MSDVTSDWPASVDDDGTGRTGTRLNVSYMDTIKTAINNQVLSATNPSVTPADTIDEVVAARGSTASLDTRLDVALNEDGTLKSTATSTLITVSNFMGGIGGVNLVTNDDFLVWAAGDAAAPTGYTLAGTGGTIARCGTALGDTTRKIGDFCAKVTRSGNDVSLSRSILSGSAFTRADYLKGLYACGGIWAKASTPNAARVGVYDGVGYTYSSYHTGGGAWEFLPVTRQINNSATELTLIPKVESSDVSAYFSGATLLLLDSDQDLVRYVESPVVYGSVHFSISGNLAVTSNAGRFEPARAGIVKYVQTHVKTAPLTTAIIFDLNTWDGASLTSMFSTRPQIAASAYRGGAAPDDAYARRCLAPQSGSSLAVGGQLTLDIDQIGTGTTGADGGIEIRLLQYTSPLERFETY